MAEETNTQEAAVAITAIIATFAFGAVYLVWTFVLPVVGLLYLLGWLK